MRLEVYHSQHDAVCFSQDIFCGLLLSKLPSTYMRCDKHEHQAKSVLDSRVQVVQCLQQLLCCAAQCSHALRATSKAHAIQLAPNAFHLILNV
jgi:hypothetical protein